MRLDFPVNPRAVARRSSSISDGADWMFHKTANLKKPDSTSTDISVLLKQAKCGEKGGQQSATGALFDQLTVQLHSIAQGMLRHERAGHSLQATALVNETCLKILQGNVVNTASNRRQLFFTAIQAMRQVLIDHARSRNAAKRGNGVNPQSLDDVLQNFEAKHRVSYLDLEIALEKLLAQSPRLHETIILRFFAGLTIAESAEVLDCSESRIRTDWRLARAKLLKWIGELA